MGLRLVAVFLIVPDFKQLDRRYSKAILTVRYQEQFDWWLRQTYFLDKSSELIFQQNDKGWEIFKKMILFTDHRRLYFCCECARGIYLFGYLPLALLSSPPSPLYPVFLLEYSFSSPNKSYLMWTPRYLRECCAPNKNKSLKKLSSRTALMENCASVI